MRTPRNKMVQPECPHCHQRRRHGERFGCCSDCGRMFAGQTAFDRHQRVDEEGSRCLDVSTHLRKDGERMFEMKADSEGVYWALALRPGQGNPWA